MCAFKIVMGLADPRGSRGAIFHIRWNDKLIGNGMMTVRERVATWLIGEFFAIPVLNGWNKLQEEVFKVDSVHKFEGSSDNAWLSAFGEDSVRVVGVERSASHELFL